MNMDLKDPKDMVNIELLEAYSAFKERVSYDRRTKLLGAAASRNIGTDE
ncbi:hypothetical protein H9S87_19010 (plasmid) [Bacillus pumilus]|nr:hypothetical protein [Bacillus pumilus]QNP18265.1 hypothetical protein H9S87_19010 [Bacillus pumilus]